LRKLQHLKEDATERSHYQELFIQLKNAQAPQDQGEAYLETTGKFEEHSPWEILDSSLLNVKEIVRQFDVSLAPAGARLVYILQARLDSIHADLERVSFEKNLGSILFLIDQSPATLFKIQDLSDSDFWDALLQLADLHLSQQFVDLGSKNNKQIALIAADVLVLSTGKLNVAIALQLKELFEKEVVFSRDGLSRSVFDLIRIGVSLKSHFEERLLKTLPLSYVSASLIRMTLSLPPNTTITMKMVGVSILSALLLPERQGEDSTCFSSFIMLGLRASNPQLVIDDLFDLITKGYLVRRVRGEEQRFEYLSKSSLNLPDLSWTINSCGIDQKTGLSFWREPHLQALFTYTGIQDPLAWVKEQYVDLKKGVHLTLSLEEVLRALSTHMQQKIISKLMCGQIFTMSLLFQ
jgi:hypothetical protein